PDGFHWIRVALCEATGTGERLASRRNYEAAVVLDGNGVRPSRTHVVDPLHEARSDGLHWLAGVIGGKVPVLPGVMTGPRRQVVCERVAAIPRGGVVYRPCECGRGGACLSAGAIGIQKRQQSQHQERTDRRDPSR